VGAPLTRGILTRQTIRAWPVGTHYEQNADSVELWTPGNRTFPSSRSPCPKYPCHGAATLRDKMKITPDCLSIGTMYLAKGLLVASSQHHNSWTNMLN
jgi:hypothetical protein